MNERAKYHSNTRTHTSYKQTNNQISGRVALLRVCSSDWNAKKRSWDLEDDDESNERAELCFQRLILPKKQQASTFKGPGRVSEWVSRSMMVDNPLYWSHWRAHWKTLPMTLSTDRSIELSTRKSIWTQKSEKSSLSYPKVKKSKRLKNSSKRPRHKC